MRFRDLFSKKQFFFAIFIFALLIPLALWDSNTQVKVTFETDAIYIKSDEYNMSIEYGDIVSAELTDLAVPGEQIEDCVDNDIIRTGKWRNETWGEYYICADVDATNCIALRLEDGRLFIFSRKDNEETAGIYETLQTYLPGATK